MRETIRETEIRAQHLDPAEAELAQATALVEALEEKIRCGQNVESTDLSSARELKHIAELRITAAERRADEAIRQLAISRVEAVAADAKAFESVRIKEAQELRDVAERALKAYIVAAEQIHGEIGRICDTVQNTNANAQRYNAGVATRDLGVDAGRKTGSDRLVIQKAKGGSLVIDKVDYGPKGLAEILTKAGAGKHLKVLS